MKQQSIILLVLLISRGISPSSAQWQPTNGPPGALIMAIAKQDSIFFAGTDHGVVRSTDNGASWMGANTGIPSGRGARCFATSGTYLFVGTGGDGVFRSSDMGLTWIEVNNGLTNKYVTVLTFSDKHLFAATDDGISRTSDNGSNWTPVNSNLPYPHFSALYASNGNLLAGTNAGSGIYCSTNEGENWTFVYPASTIWDFVSCGTNLFALVDGGVLFSTDNGSTWSHRTLDSRYVFSALVASEGVLLAGTERGNLYISADNGTEWTPLNARFGQSQVAALYSEGPDILAGTQGGGIFRSTDNGSSWAPMNTGLTFSLVYSLATIGDVLFAATLGAGIYRSTDLGNHWIPISADLPDFWRWTLVAEGDELFAAGDSGVFRSSDNGSSWIAASEGLTDIGINVIAASSNWAGSSVLVAGIDDRVALSTNSGISWTEPPNAGLHAVIFDVGIVDTCLYVCTSGKGLVYRSTDMGAQWIATSQGLDCDNAQALVQHGADLFVGTDHGVFRSTDGGTSWTSASIGLPQSASVDCFASSGDILLVGTYDHGAYFSSNSGASWTAFNSGLTDDFVQDFALIDTILFAGMYHGGICRRSLLDVTTTVGNEHRQVPIRYSLEQNFPNPFNPSTTIHFTIPTDSFVSLEVYDLLGRLAATLASEELRAGTHTRRWDAEGFPSGVYLYRLLAGSHAETKKLILVR